MSGEIRYKNIYAGIGGFFDCCGNEIDVKEGDVFDYIGRAGIYTIAIRFKDAETGVLGHGEPSVRYKKPLLTVVGMPDLKVSLDEISGDSEGFLRSID